MKKNAKNFSYFTNGNDPKTNRKELTKKILKWLKIVFYVLIFGLTVTGCVQSFVIKNSYNVGNGLEFYRDKGDIAPRVNTLKSTNQKRDLVTLQDPNGENKTSEVFEFDRLALDTESNIFVSDKEILNKLRDQTKSHQGEYGIPGGYMSVLRIPFDSEILKSAGYKFDEKFKLIYTGSDDSKNYLFATASDKTYNFVKEPKDIFIFPFTFPQDEKNNYDKGKLQSYMTFKTEKKYKEVNGKQEVDKIIPILTDAKEYEITYISGIQKIYDYTSENESVSNKFARDILQMLYTYSFGEGSKFAAKLGKEPSLFIKELVDNIPANVKEENISEHNNTLFTLTQEQYQLLIEYQNTMQSYMNELGFFNGEVPNSSSEEYKERREQVQNQYKLNRTDKYDYNTNILYSENINTLPLRGDLPLQAITTWGEAWKYGPFYGLLVYPLSVLVQSMRQSMPDMLGWASVISIIVAIIISRLITLAFTFRTTVMQSVMEELKYKKAAIEAKYKGLEDNKAMKLKKNQEIQALYTKYNINPLDQFGNMLLTMPIFLAMWRVIQSIPEIKQTTWLGINFASTSYKRLFEGEWVYLWILVLVVGFQLLSSFLPRLLNRKKMKRKTTIAEAEALKKSERTQKIMMLVFTAITLIFTAGVQVYWLFGSIWTIMQTLIIHKLIHSKKFKEKFINKKTR